MGALLGTAVVMAGPADSLLPHHVLGGLWIIGTALLTPLALAACNTAMGVKTHAAGLASPHLWREHWRSVPHVAVLMVVASAGMFMVSIGANAPVPPPGGSPDYAGEIVDSADIFGTTSVAIPVVALCILIAAVFTQGHNNTLTRQFAAAKATACRPVTVRGTAAAHAALLSTIGVVIGGAIGYVAYATIVVSTSQVGHSLPVVPWAQFAILTVAPIVLAVLAAISVTVPDASAKATS